MRKRFRLGLMFPVLLCGAFAGLSETGYAAIAFVDSNKTAATNTGTSATITQTAAAGNVVVIVVAANIGGNAFSVSSITDTGGNSYASQNTKDDGTTHLELWSTTVTTAMTSGTITISVSNGSTRKWNGIAARYSGVQANGASAVGGGTSTTPTISLTTQDANNFVVAGFGAGGTATYSANTGNLRNSNVSSGNPSGSNVGTAANDNTAAAPGSVTNTATLSSSETWTAIAFELRSTTGAGARKRLTLLGVG